MAVKDDSPMLINNVCFIEMLHRHLSKCQSRTKRSCTKTYYTHYLQGVIPENIDSPPMEGILVSIPHPLASYLSHPLPLWIYMEILWGKYEYFLELLNIRATPLG